jgi:hypothetical protein
MPMPQMKIISIMIERTCVVIRDLVGATDIGEVEQYIFRPALRTAAISTLTAETR